MIKKIFSVLLISFIAISVYSAPNGKGSCSGCRGTCSAGTNFVDANNNGVCDVKE